MTEKFSNPSAADIPGYKPQSEANLAIVKEHKLWEERALRHLDWLGGFVTTPDKPGVDPRWLAIARTELEKAFMFANRAIMQPGRIALPEDANPDKLAANQQPYAPKASK